MIRVCLYRFKNKIGKNYVGRTIIILLGSKDMDKIVGWLVGMVLKNYYIIIWIGFERRRKKGRRVLLLSNLSHWIASFLGTPISLKCPNQNL